MNILIDTNILIPLEDTGQCLDADFAEIKRLVGELRYTLFLHPAQMDDINNDKDIERRNIMLSRTNQYSLIESPPIPTEEDLNNLGLKQGNDHDRVDNLLLFGLYRGTSHLLITNDTGIHKKAALLGVNDKVHRHEQFLLFLKNQIGADTSPPSGIEEKYLHEFDVNQAFFDSLRKGYDGFNSWYLEKAREQRKAWAVEDAKNMLSAICIFKEERSATVTDDGIQLQGKILKLCTFKISELMRGRKLGERLLYTAFKHAAENAFDWVYLTMDEAAQYNLQYLCEDYGFESVGRYGPDQVFAKRMDPDIGRDLSALEYSRLWYPHYKDGPEIQKFIVPIKEEFHDELFPDISDFSTTMFRNLPQFYPPQSNTIKKAYICRAPTNQIKKGDLLLFYRSGDRKSIETIGVVEIAEKMKKDKLVEVQSLVSKRTVYTQGEISEMFNGDKVLVILFRHMRYFEAINRSKLIDFGVLGSIFSIRKISNEVYDKINECIE